VNVRFRQLPIFSLGNDTSLCAGKPLQLNPALPKGKYLWSNRSVTASINVNASGLYWLQVADSGCAKSDSITINFKPVPVVWLGNDTSICKGQTILLNAANNNATCTWQDGATGSTYAAKNSGIYTVKVSLNGCDASAALRLSTINIPAPSLGADTTVCINRHLLLNSFFDGATYKWQDGSIRPQFDVAQPGIYSVQVSNQCGSGSDTINVQYENCACKIAIPNAFTPNNDGKNDVFRPSFQCLFSNYKLRIFGRWGQAVFISQTPSAGWDGNFKDEPQPAGGYLYEITYQDDLTGKSVRKTGTFILLR
jgi:gliding motility-associated-like protein